MGPALHLQQSLSNLLLACASKGATDSEAVLASQHLTLRSIKVTDSIFRTPADLRLISSHCKRQVKMMLRAFDPNLKAAGSKLSLVRL